MQENNIIFFLFASSVAILLISIGLVVFVAFFFRSKKNTLIKEQKNKLQFEQNLARTRTEVQANTLGYISRELHDNVGQLLVVANQYIGRLKAEIGDNKLNELDEILWQTVTEVRNISKSLNEQGRTDFKLLTSLQNEIARIEKLKLIQFSTDIAHQPLSLSTDQQLILFRIMQEFISNTLKHSEARRIMISLAQTTTTLHVSLADNGVGYEPSAIANSGSGLKNMRTRAQMLGATINTQSVLNQGSSLHLSIPL